ncbi:MAG: PAS domain S-box protein [Desulfobacteraceae bacterium]|nr:MAG: PAS domain S-box protein [Desulfobacteraceae bacterium]
MRPLGKAIGNCRILKQIYESPSSAVYRAVRQSDRKPVVLKVLKQNHSARSEWNRYKHEYEILCKLRDVKNVIRAYSLDAHQKTLVMVLEDFGGESLKSSITFRPATGKGLLPLEDFLDLALELARGLAGIHDANVIHKNVNPGNVLLNRATRQVKLIDFGFSSILVREYPSPRPLETLEGSLHYIAPEQTGRMNREVDYRADLYSLGVTLYEVLTGRLPFEGDDPLTLIHSHMAKLPLPPKDSNPNVPPMISNMVMRLLAKNAEDRYQSASGLTADLERFRKGLSEPGGDEDLSADRFELGRDDFCGHFHLPQRLYGRDAEISELLSSFDRAAAGSQEVIAQDLLDTASLLKANQILSQTVNTSDLLKEMIKILIESAGAEEALVLCRDEKTWFIEARGNAGGQPVQTGMHLPPSADHLSMSILHYVINSEEVVVLANARGDPQFRGDPYLREKSIKSVLCLPVRHEGELTLVLYLENNLTAGAFTEGRLGLLQLLSGQMAISLKNASMVDALKSTIAERKRTEEVLREGEERLRIVLDATSDGIWEWNFVTRSGYVNPGYYAILGYEPGEFSPNLDNWRVRAHPEDLQLIEKVVREALGERSPFSVEFRLRRKDGRWIWVHGRGKGAEWDADGNVVRVVGSVSDISARKEAEEALRESAEQYRIMTSTSMDGFMIVDRDARILDANEAYCRIVGYSRDDLLRMTVHDLETMESSQETLGHIQRVIESGSDRFESRHRKKDGSMVDVEISLMSYRRSSRLLCYLRDVTELKRADEELRKAIMVLENSPAVLFRWRAERGFPVEFVSKNVTQFGYTVEELQSGKVSFLSMIHPEDRKWLGPEVREADKRGDLHFQKVYRLVTKEGKSRWVDDRTMIERDANGRATHHQGILLDITERKSAEEELARHRDHLEELVRDRSRELEAAQEQLVKREKLSVLGQLTAIVSHELRNPLGVIRSSTFYLQEKIKDRDQKIRKHLDRIETQVDLCDKIVGELLEYTRGSSSEMMKGEITHWLERQLENFQGTEGIRVTSLFSDNLPKVSFDEGKMTRVLNNILENAVHAVNEMTRIAEEEKRDYEPRIRVEACRAEGGIVIRVEDNGTGMDGETARRASEPLFTTKARGTGLGLAIVKKIVEEHGGTLNLESELRRGTKVNLWLPVHEGLPGTREQRWRKGEEP